MTEPTSQPQATPPPVSPEKPWRPRRTRSISFRLSLLVSFSILLFCAAVTYTLYSGFNRLYVSEKTNQWEILIKSITPNLVNLVANRDIESVTRILNQISAENIDITDITLLDDRGAVLYSTSPDIEGKTFRDPDKSPFTPGRGKHPVAHRVLQTGGITRHDFLVDIRAGDTRLGALRASFLYLSVLEKERLNSTLMLERAVRDSIKQSITGFDFYQVNFIAREAIKQFPDVRGFRILNQDADIVGSSSKKELFSPASPADKKTFASLSTRKPYTMRSFSRAGHRFLLVNLGVFDGDQKYGMLQVRYALDALDASIRRVQLLIAALTLASLLLAVGVALYIAARIARPVVQLAQMSGRVAVGDLDASVTINSGGDELRFLSTSFNNMVKGLKEREFIKDTFSRYVTRQVAEELIKHPDKVKVGGQKQEVTVLFSDIRGFTNFSEKHPPEQVVSQLNEYLSAMIDVIFKYEGTLDKFIGDAIMAVYGVPIPHPDDAERAVKTALEMQSSLRALNIKWEKEGKPTLNIGVGINTGDVIAGNIGDIRRMEYTVIGDNVNLASRLESLTKQYDAPIIISDTTFLKVSTIATVEPIDLVRVKGKEQQVQIHRLTGLK